MKVSELEGSDLDLWVARAGGHPKGRQNYVAYSTVWAVGGPIIEREGIKLKDGMFEKWRADLKTPYYKYGMEGPTALIAAMRTFVSSRFGVEVDDSQAD